MPPLVQDCVAKQMEIFDVPPEVADDLSAGGVYITRMGPPELRKRTGEQRGRFRKNDFSQSQFCVSQYSFLQFSII